MSEAEVLFEKRGRAGVITLNRPRALNAVTLTMVREMTPQLLDWARDDGVHHVIIRAAGDKAFSAGGDIRALYDWGLAQDPMFLTFYREEYQLDHLIKRYPKPYIALMDGIAMGGGVGVSVNGSHRVATDRLTFAMPETGIGLFPDVGGTYFLPRCPGNSGMFLGLTGTRLKAADALWAGIVTHYCPQDELDSLFEDLCASDDVDKTLSALAEPPEAPFLPERQDRISSYFGRNSIATIVAGLAEAGEDDWAQKQFGILAQKSPTSLAITHEQLTRGAELDFEDCLKTEFRMVNRIFTAHDFFEGTRAVVIDKDQAPKWSPATMGELSEDVVSAYFAPLADELTFIER